MSRLEHQEDGGLIPPETRRLAGLLGRPKTGEMLALLGARPHQSATDIARTLDIHVATAQRYLKDMVDAGILRVRDRRGGTRPTEEYRLAEEHIQIHIDLSRTGDPTSREALVAEAGRYTVRDAGAEGVVYDVDSKTGYVQEILLLSDGGRREVRERIPIPPVVGRFLVEVPGADAPARTVWEVAQRAGLAANRLPELMGAVGVLGGGRTEDHAVPAAALTRHWSHATEGLRAPEAWQVLAVDGPVQTGQPTKDDADEDTAGRAACLVEATAEGSA